MVSKSNPYVTSFSQYKKIWPFPSWWAKIYMVNNFRKPDSEKYSAKLKIVTIAVVSLPIFPTIF